MSRTPIKYGFEPPTELFQLAEGVRNLVDKMLVIEHSHDELVEARRAVDAIADKLAHIGRKGINARLMPDMAPGPEDERPYFAGDAARWHYNPLNPPMTLEVREGTVHGTVRLGLAYEGPPGCVHGGFVAMLLDQLLGQVNGVNGIGAMTASLSVSYLHPTPLLTELVLEAPPPKVIEDRKCITYGSISANGRVTAEAEGLFILPDFSKLVLPHLKRRPEEESDDSDSTV